jgi:hypothetical protein
MPGAPGVERATAMLPTPVARQVHAASTSDMVALPMMKHAKDHHRSAREVSTLTFLCFIRCAAVLTFCVGPIVILNAAILSAHNANKELWVAAAFVTLFPIWAGTLIVGCLVTVPVAIWRLGKRLAQEGAR